MSLIRYKQKRDFKSTSEPEGGKPKSGQLIFVIQKHAASRLHYDFRLEMDGVLKSWAVPKGPSADPAVKRLAMMVEDHPFNYRDFEGTIPEGNYGAGTVIVWDQGTYEPIEKIDGKKAQDKHLLRQLKDGSVKIVMKGKKMKGEWALVRTKQSENSWLLIKHRDKYATETDITEKSKSVVSGKTLEQIEKAMSGTNGIATPKKNSVKSTTRKSTSTKKTATAKKATLVKKVAPAKKASVAKKAAFKAAVSKTSKKKASR
ncbi:MAG: DNA polymerase ligase N-terminal domain-containing protein [Saprospiraceae bacterium]